MAKYRERPPFPLGLDPAAYNPHGLRAYEDADLKREYSRLYQEAKTRLRGLGRSREWSQTRAYLDNKDRFTQPRYVKDRAELEDLIADAARFVTARGSSVQGLRGIRRDAISKLHENGYDWVNTKNFNDWTDFMEEVRANHEENLYYGDPHNHKDKKADKEELYRAFQEWLGLDVEDEDEEE